MAPVLLKKLTSTQDVRKTEIEGTRTCLTSKPLESLTLSMVQARIDAIKEIWVEARATHLEISVRDDAENDAYITENKFGGLQTVYEDALDSFLNLLKQLTTADETIISGAANVTVLNQSDADASSGAARLPKIPLPTFSGKYEDWD